MEHLILEFTFRALLIAAAAGAVLAVLRIRTAAAQHALWTGVLAAMLVLPAWLAWGPKTALPVLPAHREPPAVIQPATVEPAVSAPLSYSAQPARQKLSTWSWSALWIVVYLAGAVALLLRLAIGTLRANRLAAASCAVPVTVGLLHPRVILPECWRDWPQPQLNAVLAHESAHVRRHDPLVQWLALLNRALFWFHPLAWWLERRLAALAEEACDAAVLAQGHDPRDYSAYLLDLARAVERAGMRVNATAVAMPGCHLPQRIRKMLAGGTAPRVSRARLASAAVACAICTAICAAGRPEPAAAPQTPPQTPPKFEVASVKRCSDSTARAGRGGSNVSPGRLSIECLTVADLVNQAYIHFANGQHNFLSNTQISGGPAWIHTERYEIDAKAEGTPGRDTMQGPMLQALLQDRFQLKIHRETKEIPVYLLTVARGGPKLQPVKEADCLPFDLAAAEAAAAAGKTLPRSCGSIWFGASTDRPGLLFAQARGISLDAFARNLGRTLDRPVIDKTGIGGLYDLRVEFAPDETTPRFQPGGGQSWLAGSPGAASDPAGPRLSTALQQQLGLKLDPGKGPGEFLIIDHVERPSEN